MRVRHAARVFGPDSSVEFRAATPSEGLDPHKDGGVTNRPLRRSLRMIEEMRKLRVLPATAHLGTSILRCKKSGVHFPEVTWQREQGFAVRHWMRLCRPLKTLEPGPEAIQFVTGTCLFGRSAMMHLADGSQRPLVSTRQSLPAPICRLTFYDDLSLYEIDTACRLSSVIGDMVGECTLTRRVFLHVPRPEYLLVMLGHQRGSCSEDIMSHWLSAVDHRSERVSELFRTLLAMRSAVQVQVGSPLDEVLMPLLRETIACGQVPSPNELAEVIRCGGTEIGELFDLWLSARKGGANFDYYDLAHFGYVAGVAVNLVKDTLTVEVDNPSEEPIFKSLARVVRRTEDKVLALKGNAMAVYPYEQMAGWDNGPVDWRPVRKTAVDSGDAVDAIMAQYGIESRYRDHIDRL